MTVTRDSRDVYCQTLKEDGGIKVHVATLLRGICSWLQQKTGPGAFGIAQRAAQGFVHALHGLVELRFRHALARVREAEARATR